MSKVTSKLQVTVPKAIAVRYGIRPGDEVEFVAAGDVVRLEPRGVKKALDAKTRLALFDQATVRQRQRQATAPAQQARGRGWTREDLYTRDRPR